MIVNFRRNRVRSNTVSFMGEEVKVVKENENLSARLESRLDWRRNSEIVNIKGHSRLYSH